MILSDALIMRWFYPYCRFKYSKWRCHKL